MVTVSWIGHGIVIVDAGEPHIRYLKSDFLCDAGHSTEAEELVRVIFDKHNAVGLVVRQVDGHWKATATIEIDAWEVVHRAGEGDTVLNALRNLIYDITSKD